MDQETLGRCPVVYLLHFERPYHHARHYLGQTNNLAERLERHRRGQCARLLEALQEAGIGWRCVRCWVGTRAFERRLKRRHNSPRLCPVCRGNDGREYP